MARAGTRAKSELGEPKDLTDNYLVFGRPSIGAEEIDAVVAVLRSGWVGTGPRVGEFEERFAEYIGCRHAVALGSCTAALHLAALSLGLGPGDEVITTPMTFVATANAILHTGARPVFVDVDPETMTLCPEQIEARVSPRTRALLPVHLAGRPCAMDPILEIARRHELQVIEDAAHAIEARYHGRKIGTIGDVTCFSFYVTKNMTTIEGGMLCTDRDAVAEKARIHALHGLSADAWSRFSDEGYQHYEAVYPGYKYNMTDVQAALGLCQLPRLEHWLKRRREIWAHYDEEFEDLPCRTPAPEEPDTTHSRHLYTLRIESDRCGLTRDAFIGELHRRGIGSGVHYRSLHTHAHYRKTFGFKEGDFPISFAIGEQTVSLPLSPTLSEDEVGRVVTAVREILA